MPTSHLTHRRICTVVATHPMVVQPRVHGRWVYKWRHSLSGIPFHHKVGGDQRQRRGEKEDPIIPFEYNRVIYRPESTTKAKSSEEYRACRCVQTAVMSDGEDSPTLSFTDVCVDIQNKRVLRNVTGRAEKGEILAIMGPSGKVIAPSSPRSPTYTSDANARVDTPFFMCSQP